MQGQCTADSCDLPMYCRSLCVKHYGRMRSHGSLADPRPSLEQRFWSKVEKGDECWLWTAGVDHHGYGVVSFDGRGLHANRVAWILAHGPIPDGLLVCHRCDVPRCVRPDHLFLGQHADNTADMMAKGRNVAPLGEKNGRSKLTAEQVRTMRDEYVNGLRMGLIAKKYGLPLGTVQHVIERRNWKHI